MKKITKGAIAAGAATLLLVGGGGTFMSWNDEVTVAQDVNAGTLELNAETGTWRLNEVDVTDTIASVIIVPGDTLTFTQNIAYVTSGDNMTATLSMAPGSITPISELDAADVALAAQLSETASFTLGEPLPAGVEDNLDDTYGFTGETNGNLTATVEIDFPVEGETTSDSRLGNVAFDGMALNFTQVTGP